MPIALNPTITAASANEQDQLSWLKHKHFIRSDQPEGFSALQ
jgi:hypothetical protein